MPDEEKTKGNESNSGNSSSRGSSHRRDVNSTTELTRKPVENRNTSRRTESEMSIRGVKCYICKQKGHMAKSCLETKKNPARMVVLDSSESTTDAGKQQPVDVDKLDPWMRTVMAEKEKSEGASDTRGPSYKVNVVVEGVKTRGFLDHGAQVSLIRKELLPTIKEKQGWIITECHERNIEMGQQPIGATGTPLGAISLVRLRVTVDETGTTKEVPCFVLASEKPIWSGELRNCGLILGTNALVDLGFQVTYSNGTVVHPEGFQVSVNPKQSPSTASSTEVEGDSITQSIPTASICKEKEGTNTSAQTSRPVLMVSLAQTVRIGPQQTAVARVRIQEQLDDQQSVTGVVVPKEDCLASMNCDLVEGMWMGQTDFTIPVTNWGSLPVTLQKGDTVAHVEEATIVSQNDDVWESGSDSTIRTIKGENLKIRQE